ncbi:hypothetical protein JANLI_53980 [Janthinobacterium lividum]|nr:hypothetical protein JANLI_53980 [Janthinobacterium lividum]
MPACIGESGYRSASSFRGKSSASSLAWSSGASGKSDGVTPSAPEQQCATSACSSRPKSSASALIAAPSWRAAL